MKPYVDEILCGFDFVVGLNVIFDMYSISQLRVLWRFKKILEKYFHTFKSIFAIPINYRQSERVYKMTTYFLIGKLKQKYYLFTLAKFQPSQLVCTPGSKRCNIRCSRKTVCANDIQHIYQRYVESAQCSIWNFWIKN